MKEVISEVVAQAGDYMVPRILRVDRTRDASRYIESNLAFMREHRNYLIAVVEILRHRLAAGGPRRVRGPNSEVAAHPLVDLLARAQAAGELREDFDPRTMAIAIRAAINTAPPLLNVDPEFDIDAYAKEIADLFDRATRLDPVDVGVPFANR